MNKVYVCACIALVLSRRHGLPFYKSHSKSVPVAVTSSVVWKDTPGEEEEEEEDQKGRRRTREKSFIESLSRLRESHSEPAAFTGRGIIAHNFLPLCFGVVSHLRRPLSCPHPATSPFFLAASDAAANLIQPRLRGKRLT